MNVLAGIENPQPFGSEPFSTFRVLDESGMCGSIIGGGSYEAAWYHEAVNRYVLEELRPSEEFPARIEYGDVVIGKGRPHLFAFVKRASGRLHTIYCELGECLTPYEERP